MRRRDARREGLRLLASLNAVAKSTHQAGTLDAPPHQRTEAGAVSISGSTNICPLIDGISASPSQVTVGDGVALSGIAHDPDDGPSPLSYRWTATARGPASYGSAQAFSKTHGMKPTVTVPRTSITGKSLEACSPAP